MKKNLTSVVTAAAAIFLGALPSFAGDQKAPAATNGSNANFGIDSPIPTPSLVPIAATAINGLAQAEFLQQKFAEDRAAAEKKLAADKAAAEQSDALKNLTENETIAVAPEPVESTEMLTLD